MIAVPIPLFVLAASVAVTGLISWAAFDPKVGRWASEILAGVKAASSMSRAPVTNPLVTAARYGDQLHVMAGATHAWFDPPNRRWYSEVLP